MGGEDVKACKNAGVNIVNKDEDILIYIYTDEYKRAKKLVGDVKDKTKIKIHRNPKQHTRSLGYNIRR